MAWCKRLLKYCIRLPKYRSYYKQWGRDLCMTNKVYQENFEKCFAQQYREINRLNFKQSSEVAKFFAYLLYTDSLSWHVLACIRLTREDITPFSWSFIDELFQELRDLFGAVSLNERLKNPAIQDSIASIFWKDSPEKAKFAVEFFQLNGLMTSNNLK